jgi:hypothetical protein
MDDAIDSLLEFATGSKRAFRDAAASGDLEHVEAALAEGVDVDSPNDYGSTALHKAAMSGQLEMVEFLLSKGADANAISQGLLTPLQEARLAGHTRIVKVLQAWKRRREEERRESKLARTNRAARSKSTSGGPHNQRRSKGSGKGQPKRRGRSSTDAYVVGR